MADFIRCFISPACLQPKIELCKDMLHIGFWNRRAVHPFWEILPRHPFVFSSLSPLQLTRRRKTAKMLAFPFSKHYVIDSLRRFVCCFAAWQMPAFPGCQRYQSCVSLALSLYLHPSFYPVMARSYPAAACDIENLRPSVPLHLHLPNAGSMHSFL